MSTPTTNGARPRGYTALIAALIRKQDAMARRTAAKIADILSRHVCVAAVELMWRHMSREVCAALGAIPARGAVRSPGLARPDVIRFLESELDEILTTAHMAADDGAPFPPLPPPEEPPTVRTSRTLAEARAQLARLQSDLMDLRARIVPRLPASLAARDLAARKR